MDKPATVSQKQVIDSIKMIKYFVAATSGMIVISWIFSLFFIVGRINIDDTTRVLETNGYTNITLMEPEFGACTPVDYYKTGFTAENHLGNKVKGTVCGTWRRSFDIRIIPVNPSELDTK